MGNARSSGRGATRLHVLGGVLGTLVSVVLVLNVFFKAGLNRHGGVYLHARFGAHEFFGRLPHHMLWLIPFCLLSALTLVLRAAQWQRTLEHRVSFTERYHLVCIGALVNNASPAKVGDLTRAFLLARTRSLPFVEALGSVAVCKLLELVALLLVLGASVLGPLKAMMGPFVAALHIAIVLCVGLVGLAVFLGHSAERMARALERRKRWPKLHTFLLEMGQGFHTARSLRGLIVALVFSIGPVLAPAIGYGYGLAGLGIPHGLWAGPLILGAIALGQSVIVVPAGTGIYYFVTAYAARKLGATADQAAAFATLSFFGTTLTQVGMGIASLSVRKIRWKDLRKRTHQAEEAEHEVEDELAPAQA